MEGRDGRMLGVTDTETLRRPFIQYIPELDYRYLHRYIMIISKKCLLINVIEET